MTATIFAPLRLAILAMFAVLFALPALAQDTSAAPAPAADPRSNLENVLYLDLSTGGRVSILLYPETAPSHVERIKTLTRQGFYNGLTFHRVIDGFMAQTGDPQGDGTGGSNLPDLKAEFSRLPHLRGTVSAAREGDNVDSANSQFFITFMPRFDLDRKYTVFGRVFGGMNFVDTIARGVPAPNPDRIVQASIAADGKPMADVRSVTVPATAPVTAPVIAPVTAPVIGRTDTQLLPGAAE